MSNVETILNKARELAQQLAACLQQQDTPDNPRRIVLAESCTAGLVAALLGQVPGISNYLCGSAVTYRASVKQDWLGVSAEVVETHTTESIETTMAMAIGVLNKTQEANFSAAITGHLGPDAPPEIDGKVFVAIAARIDGSVEIVLKHEAQLNSATRMERQYEAAATVLERLIDVANSQSI